MKYVPLLGLANKISMTKIIYTMCSKLTKKVVFTAKTKNLPPKKCK